MLGLKLPTDPRWVNLVESNFAEILTDHAWCEQKAATNAISLIVSYPENVEMVSVLSDIAQEEMLHFKLVHDIIIRRGYKLGPKRKDDYVNKLMTMVRTGATRDIVLMDKLLFAALIEARSCERFKMLSEKIKDPELAHFYHGLMASEASHYTTFIKLAHTYVSHLDVDKRWQEFLNFEAGLMQNYSKKETMHG
jgi:tRNA-(ms[2]io[6]A)-hydroxylase